MKRIVVSLLLYGLLSTASLAQETTYLSLQADSLALQTGQTYEIRIQLDGAVDLWLASAEIEYDPAAVYVIGTKSGSPITKGPFFSPADSIIVRNEVDSSGVIYTVSQLGLADAVSGRGTAGSFRIHPLKAGATVLRFRRAELIATTFTGEGANRTAENRRLTFSSVQLELTITGDSVEPPSEATATPEPTATTFVPMMTQPAEQPTLENLSALPTSPDVTSAPVGEMASDPADNSSIVFLSAALIIGAVGAIIGLLLSRRMSK